MKRIIIAALVGFAAAVVVLGLTGCASASYSARVTDHDIASASRVDVWVSVVNTGSKAGTPDVTVTVSDPSGAYTGVDVFTPTRPIQPGSTGRVKNGVSRPAYPGAAFHDSELR